MLAKNFKKSLLAVNIGLVMSAGFTGAAFAADENQVQEDVEVIEVRGIRRSLEAALNTKRFADDSSAASRSPCAHCGTLISTNPKKRQRHTAK